ncbi:MAG: hypothetical protein K0R00_931 [Herbinix sp.]|jgi:hypothetical protein|nr:hypothetical protein [Herbinix sp.]
MKSDKNDFSISSEEIEYIIAALNLFITNNIDGISQEKKHDDNIIALSALRKLNARETVKSGEEYRVMLAALYYFLITVNRSITPICTVEFKQEAQNKLAVINYLISKIERLIHANGN